MRDHHRLAYAALAVVYVITAVVLTLEHAFAHAICSATAALIYIFMSRRASDRRPAQ
jgi:hypothetical protein